MKKINFLYGKAGHDKPQLVLSIFISLIFITTPLTGLLNPGKVLNITEKHYHENPQGFSTFFTLFPDKNSFEDSARSNMADNEVKELAKDTTPGVPVQKTINVVTW